MSPSAIRAIILKGLSFLDVPKGRLGWSYHLLLMVLSFCYIAILLLETSDGPNQYEGRANMALYFFLPTKLQYEVVKASLSAPLLAHVLSDVALSMMMIALSWRSLLAKLRRGKFGKLLKLGSFD